MSKSNICPEAPLLCTKATRAALSLGLPLVICDQAWLCPLGGNVLGLPVTSDQELGNDVGLPVTFDQVTVGLLAPPALLMVIVLVCSLSVKVTFEPATSLALIQAQAASAAGSGAVSPGREGELRTVMGKASDLRG